MKTLLDKLKADLTLCNNATPGPWCLDYPNQVDPLHLVSTPHPLNGEEGYRYNPEFLAASRTRWPATTRALIKAIEALQEMANLNWHCDLKNSSVSHSEKALADIEEELNEAGI